MSISSMGSLNPSSYQPNLGPMFTTLDLLKFGAWKKNQKKQVPLK